MAKVIVELRVLPKDVEVNLENLEKEISAAISPEKISREPIAFGLVALKITKIVEDKAGEIDRLEEELKKIKDIGGIEIDSLTRSI